MGLNDDLVKYINTGKGDPKALINRALYRIVALEGGLGNVWEKIDAAHTEIAQSLRETNADQ